MSINLNVPDGTGDLIYEEAELVDQIIEGFAEIYKRGGFRRVRTSALEYYDLFDYEGQSIPQESMYKLTDNSGRLAVLRADNTTPVARIISTRLKDASMPQRMYYNQHVYRISSDYSGQRSEILQSGVEIVGERGMESDLQCVVTAIEALKTLNIPFKVELGHVGFYNSLISELSLDEAETKRLREYVDAKSLAKLPNSSKIARIPMLYGGAEVFSEAEKLAAGNAGALAALDYTRALFDDLVRRGYGEYIMIDFGIVHKIDYYTGMVFRGYVAGGGAAALTGGRYDRLLANFGRDLPATGFALDVSLISQYMSGRGGERARENEDRLRIALTKGRIEENALKLLAACGYDCSELDDDKRGRKLLFSLGGSGIEVVLAKAADVITYVEHGVCDVGIVGADTLMEHSGTVYELLDLGFGKCRFALAGPKGRANFIGHSRPVIASKYPNVTKQYFNSRGVDVEVVKIEGSVELAPVLKLSDAIVDIVETGSTLKANGLEIYDDVAPISARLIANIASVKLKKRMFDPFMNKITEAVEKNAENIR